VPTEAFIFEALRTPRGKVKKGSLHSVKPVDLVVGLIDELRSRFPDLDEDRISDVLLGVVSPIGDQGADIARTAVLAAKMPNTVGGVQLNRFCGSGLETVNLAAQKVRSGFDDLVLAGGVESMSRVPMGSDGGAIATDPATNYDIGFAPQGIGADLIATMEGFSREDVDAYAVRSQQLAAAAWTGGYFAKSVVPVKDLNGLTVLDHDEHMRPGTMVEDLAVVPILELGPQVETHEHFPNRTNVEFVQRDGDDVLTVRFWERGVGVTLASGSGSTAAVAAAGLERATVRTLGGDLVVERGEDGHLYQTGPAAHVYDGALP